MIGLKNIELSTQIGSSETSGTNRLTITVYDSAGRAQAVGKQVARGGEGTVYQLKDKAMDHVVIKIYHNQQKAAQVCEKITAMVSCRNEFNNPWLCWPRATIHNKSGSFIGYAMRKAEGHILFRLLISQYRKRYFPDWNRLTVARLAGKILSQFNALHRKGVLIGDINTRNIMVDRANLKAYFIDADSFQFQIAEKLYPCEVGTADYTAPELHRGKLSFSKIRRTVSHENFAVAVLLFQMFMDGRHPFDRVNGATMQENIISGAFPYGEFQSKNGNARNEKRVFAKIPPGEWYRRWKAFPYLIKSSFLRTFIDGHNNSSKRVSVDKWLAEMNKYISMMERGWIPKNWILNDKEMNRKYMGKKELQTRGEHL